VFLRSTTTMTNSSPSLRGRSGFERSDSVISLMTPGGRASRGWAGGSECGRGLGASLCSHRRHAWRRGKSIIAASRRNCGCRLGRLRAHPQCTHLPLRQIKRPEHRPNGPGVWFDLPTSSALRRAPRMDGTPIRGGIAVGECDGTQQSKLHWTYDPRFRGAGHNGARGGEYAGLRLAGKSLHGYSGRRLLHDARRANWSEVLTHGGR